ncbi:MAG: hypothetical protein R3F17_11600, partial [Planctomycetota bacterium]
MKLRYLFALLGLTAAGLVWWIGRGQESSHPPLGSEGREFLSANEGTSDLFEEAGLRTVFPKHDESSGIAAENAELDEGRGPVEPGMDGVA